jgi:succinyl-CoA synthetase beta subunit
MARLHEHQGKSLLREHGITVPRGAVARDGAAAQAAAADLGGDVVLKVQAWVTGRKDKGGVRFLDANALGEAGAAADELLALSFGNFPVTEVLVEERLDIRHELFVSLNVDDQAQAPVLLLDARGGTGIEDRAAAVARVPVSATDGVDPAAVAEALGDAPIEEPTRAEVVETVTRLVSIARECEARSLEVNPLVTTGDGRVVAADCRITIDDYAVFRHPELGIEIARELDHPATPLERAAYRIESEDHRGTFYFAQLSLDDDGGLPRIGFHGAGGGGSMMSMDAVTNAGFTLANFCDTSGNPSVAKVYRAARIILAQPGLVGYFGSGSGVASQEQYHSAYGLAKAFRERRLGLPAVIRLGGNSEDRAVEILESACADVPGCVEGYRKDDTPAFCAERFRFLVDHAPAGVAAVAPRAVPAFVGAAESTSFPVDGGQVWIDRAGMSDEAARVVVEHGHELLAIGADGVPALAVSEADVANKDSELIACEIECARAGHPVVFVDLPIAELDGAEGAG